MARFLPAHWRLPVRGRWSVQVQYAYAAVRGNLSLPTHGKWTVCALVNNKLRLSRPSFRYEFVWFYKCFWNWNSPRQIQRCKIEGYRADVRRASTYFGDVTLTPPGIHVSSTQSPSGPVIRPPPDIWGGTRRSVSLMQAFMCAREETAVKFFSSIPWSSAKILSA